MLFGEDQWQALELATATRRGCCFGEHLREFFAQFDSAMVKQLVILMTHKLVLGIREEALEK